MRSAARALAFPLLLALGTGVSLAGPGSAPPAGAPAVPPTGAEGPLAASQVTGALWSRALTQSIWSNRDGHTALVFDGKLWVLGGWGTGPLNDVWSSADGLSWTQVAAEAPWSPRKSHASVVWKGRMWVLGGSLGVEPTADVWSSPDGARWDAVTADAPWGQRNNHAAVVFQDRLWVLGGWGGRDLNDVWSSPDGVTWTRVAAAAPWSPRNGHTAVVFQDRLWVFGGWGGREAGTEGNLNDVWSTADGEHWERVTGRAPWAPRNHAAAIPFAGRLFLLGGWGGWDGPGPKDGNLNDVWTSADGAEWKPATGQAQWLPRNGHTAAVFQDRLWILGGWSQFIGGTSVNDLWYATH